MPRHRKRPPFTQKQKARALSCYWLAVSYAHRWQHRYPWLGDEAESTALYAILKAAVAYDPTREAKFSTYAANTLRSDLNKLVGNAKISRRRDAGFTETPFTDLWGDDLDGDAGQPFPFETGAAPHERAVEQSELVERATAAMSFEESQLLRWRHVEDLTLRQIGARMHRSPEWVRLLLNRTHARLRTVIDL
jgi:RNA polymerase sigma factor (sigma-70 family)